MTRTIWLPRTAAFLLALLLAGCADLPDLGGYGAATVEVRQSVAVAGSAVGTEIRNAASVIDDKAVQTGVRESADRFDNAWAVTIATMDAMADYAASIEAIAQSGNKGKESVSAVADQIDGLGKAVAAIFPPAAVLTDVVAATRGAAEFIGDQAAKVRAARDLREAIARAGPSIVRLQSIVQLQIRESRAAFNSSLIAQEGALVMHTDALAVRKQVRTKRKSAENDLAAYVKQDNRDEARVDAKRAEIARLDQIQSSVSDQLAAYDANVSAIAGRRTAGIALLDACDRALAAWAAAHSKLVEAITTHRTLTLGSLVAAATDLRELTKQWRESKP